MNVAVSRLVSDSPKRGPGIRPLAFFAFIIVLLAGFGVYSWYWLRLRGTIMTKFDRFVAGERAAGVDIGFDRVSVGGFPFRFKGVLRGVDVRFDTGWRWRTNRAVFFVSAFNPNRIEAELAQADQFITTRHGEEWRVRANHFHAGATLAQGRLVDLGLRLRGVGAHHRNGHAQFADVIAFATLTPGREPDLQLSLQLRDGLVDPGLHHLNYLGRDFTRAEAKVWLRGARPAGLLDAVFSPKALRDWAARGGTMQLTEAGLDWGPARFALSGDLGLDAARRPEGRLNFEIRRAGGLVEALIGDGQVDARAGEALRAAAALSLLAGGAAPLSFRLTDGAMRLGPIKVFSVDSLP